MADVKIYRLDCCSWYAANSLMEFLSWYHKNIDTIEIPEDLQELEEIAPDKGTMWSNTNITEADIEELGDYEEVCKGGLGDLMKRDGEIYKLQTFADVIGDEEIKEPYEIASTEW